MWHEARKQERLIRGMIVDYRRRAERRKDFYEKIKAEPTQFLQLHGRPCKIHLDPAIAAAGDSPAIMMPWQGDANNLIDRFDVRAHLDYIPEVKNVEVTPEELNTEERQCNYERYRILAQNNFLGIGEDKFLQQLAIEEKFGVTIEEKEAQREKLNEKKGSGAAIGYNYNDPGAQPTCSTGPEISKSIADNKDSDDDSDLEIIDVDLSIDVNKMDASQAHELNGVGPLFGMSGCDLFSFLTGDADDADHQKQLLREEKEKAMFSGRKSRRERRAHRDKKLATRVLSPPSYAAPSTAVPREPSRSPSRSPSPYLVSDKIQFITSFGGDEDEIKPVPPLKPLYADKVKQNLRKMEKLYSEAARGSKRKIRSPSADRGYKVQYGPHRPKSWSRSRSRSGPRSRSPRPRSPRSRSPRPRSPRSRSPRPRSPRPRSPRSRSPRPRSPRPRSPRYRSRTRSRSRSRSRPRRRRSRSRSLTNHASNFGRRSDSRSMSFESNDKINQNKAAIPRYYGRRKDDKQSSSELSLDSDSSDGGDIPNKATVGGKSNTIQNQLRLTGSSTKGIPSRETLTLKEKLKRKMQVQLSRQLQADKRAEAERAAREGRRQARRDREMRELAIKLRRRQREMRHQQNQRSSDDSDKSGSRSSSRDSQDRDRRRDRRSRSTSRSQPRKTVPVWETSEDIRDPTPEKYSNVNTRDGSHHRDSPKRGNPANYERSWEDSNRHPRQEGHRDNYRPTSYRNYENTDFEGRNYRQRSDYDSHSEPRRDDYQNYRRRPYSGYRGSYRGNSRRYGQGLDDNQVGPAPPSDGREGNSSAYARNKIKLVDY